MAMIFIDYTAVYYTAIARKPVPAVVSGKFVQIRQESTLYLVLSPKDFTKYHANIIERFCMDKGIEGGYDPERRTYDIFDTSWGIVGGGKFDLDKNKKTIKLYDNSMAYGKFDETGLKEMLSALPELSGYEIIIE